MTILVVVESPNKIPKISKCLGPGFRVVATVGHFRDLPENELGVDLSTFTPHYVTKADKAAVVAKLKKEACDATEVLLGTDADREGEAIAWHVASVIDAKGPKRIRFQEITPAALKKAVASASVLDQHQVDAQQARRVLDRLVGFQVSPLLAVLGTGHSAGRVQSAVLHLVVTREKAREAFVPVEYWLVQAKYAEGFVGKVATLNEKKRWVVTRFKTKREAEAAAMAAQTSRHTVSALETQPIVQRPPPPFKTSTLQQAASAQLQLNPTETMALAQSLFEKGAISYHRSDSLTLSDEAIEMAREFLRRDAPELLPEAPVRYKNKDSAQEAHEAIRPTALVLRDVVLTPKEETLFSLISRRFLACQCKPALLEKTTAHVEAGQLHLIVSGTIVRFDSFRRFAVEDDGIADPDGDNQVDAPLPALMVGQSVTVSQMTSSGDKSKPLNRFTQATLVHEMERTGIGRPSTFDSTVATLIARRYIVEEKKTVAPTPRGRLVDGALEVAVPGLVETSYTAEMESALDQIATGKRRWKDSLQHWYGGFEAHLRDAQSALRAFVEAHPAELAALGDEVPKPTGRPCPRCQSELLQRKGRHGLFLACPSCKFMADSSSRPHAHPCPKCAGPMHEVDGKFGRRARCVVEGCAGVVDLALMTKEMCPRCEKPLKDRGAFLGCSDYPSCNYTVDAKALAKARKSGCSCPKCGLPVVERKGSKGRFLSCTGFPKCRHAASLPGKPEVARAR